MPWALTSEPLPEDALSGAKAHLGALEALYASAPINGQYDSKITLDEAGRALSMLLMMLGREVEY